jgi:uncharacterized membrane-anchored protein YhcB (DUF1043 family)
MLTADSDSGSFLTASAADIISVLGLVGVGATIIGLVIGWLALRKTLEQLRKQVEATEAARKATQETFEELRQQHAAFIRTLARRYFGDVKRHVQDSNVDLTLVRVADLRDQLAQLGGGEDGSLADLKVELGMWDSEFRKRASGPSQKLTTRSSQDRWLEFCQNLTVVLEREANPLRQPLAGKELRR